MPAHAGNLTRALAPRALAPRALAPPPSLPAPCLPTDGWALAWDAAPVTDLEVLRDRMRRFAEDRDWGRFHDPKSVLLALVGEVGELAELFQWLPAAEARGLARPGPLRP